MGMSSFGVYGKMRSQSHTAIQSSGEKERGIALVASLLLVVVVGIVGATVLETTSTEIKISGNYREAVQNFYAAEAGIAEGQARLRRMQESGSGLIGDPVVGYNPRWSAYILTSSTWAPGEDPGYSTLDTNFIPTLASQTSTIIQPNSLQSSLTYWVKIKHKTEYDAEQAGHRSGTPHYDDGDGSLSMHNAANVGKAVYYGYPTAEAEVPTQFTSPASGTSFPVELLRAVGGSTRNETTIQVELVHPPGPNPIGALYALGPVTLTGLSGIISGDDRCGVVPGIPPVYTRAPASTTGTPTFSGVPPSPVQGPVEIGLSGNIGELRPGSMVIMSDQMNQNFGSPTAYLTLYSDTSNPGNPGGLIIRNGIGYGILLVEGDLTLEGTFTWNGLILITGHLLLKGEGKGIEIRGAIWAGQVTDLTGIFDIQFDSCQVKASLLAQPLKVRSWKEEF